MINSIESVQRRFTKKLVGMSPLINDERCASLRLDRLELRRLHSDLLTCFKIIRGFTVLDRENFLPLVAIALLVVSNSNYVCNNIELTLEDISSARVWLRFGTNYRPRL